jgi:hypothetical protein
MNGEGNPHQTLGTVPSYQDEERTTRVRLIRPLRQGTTLYAVELNFGRDFAIGHTPREARAIAKLLELAADEAERSIAHELAESRLDHNRT